jgi:hypothetical protein
MRLKICTEADYLQAHITVLGAEPRPGNQSFAKLKLWGALLLKRWSPVAQTSARVPSRVAEWKRRLTNSRNR